MIDDSWSCLVIHTPSLNTPFYMTVFSPVLKFKLTSGALCSMWDLLIGLNYTHFSTELNKLKHHLSSDPVEGIASSASTHGWARNCFCLASEKIHSVQCLKLTMPVPTDTLRQN